MTPPRLELMMMMSWSIGDPEAKLGSSISMCLRRREETINVTMHDVRHVPGVIRGVYPNHGDIVECP